jgi:heat shock protein HtpX
MTLYQHQANNKRRTWLLMMIFLILVIGVGYAISWYFESPGILIAAVIFSVVSSFVSYWWSDKIVLSMAGARLVDPNVDKEIYRLVENLCITAGLSVPKIYIIEDDAPNAFATGRNPEHAAIAFTTGLLRRLDKVEVEGVAAHELSHIGNYDILISTIATVLVGVIIIMIDWFSRGLVWGGGRRSDDSKGSNPLGLILVIVLLILAPLAAQLMQLAISRKREYLADSSAGLLTRYPEGLARALEKISVAPQNLKRVNAATAHMYIVTPLQGDEKKNKTSAFSKLLMTHPPIEERVARLRNLDIN